MTTIKITALTDIGATIPSTTLIPVVDMIGTPTTDKATFGNVANAILSQAGNTYNAASKAVTVTANAQPNITSVGTLSVNTLKISGGSSEQVLTTDGLGNLSWETSSGSTGDITFDASNISTDLANTDIQIIANGSGNVNVSVSEGNVWRFGNDGNLYAPFDLAHIDSGYETANVGFASTNTLATTLFYDSGNIASQLLLNRVGTPTAGDHLVQLALYEDNANAPLTWTFDNEGDLTLPTVLGGDTSIGTAFNTNPPNHTLSLKHNGGVNEGSGGELKFDYGTAEIKVVKDAGSTQTWEFGSDGNLTLPGNTFSVNYANGTQVPLSGTYGNSNVASYLPTYTGNIGSNNVNATGNVSGGNLVTAGKLYSAGLNSNGVANITNNTISTSSTTGALKVSGGIGVAGNIHGGDEIHSGGNIIVGGQSLFVGPYANTTGLTNPTLVIFHGGSTYVQAALKNSLSTGSADWVAYGDNGTDEQGWADFGFTSTEFNDINYTITGPGDGYFFVNTYAGSYGGNLVLSTGPDGTIKDIIFGTGGFDVNNEFGRISHSNNSLELTKTGASLTFPDGSIQTTAYTGGGGGGNTGNVTFDNVNIIGDGNLKLQPDPANANAYLDIYLTSGPDIHIASNGETVILGTDDYANVTVNIDGKVYVQANAGTQYTWTFDTDGNLKLPSGGGVWFNYGYIDQDVSILGDALRVSGGNNVVITTNEDSFTWLFDATGNLTLPGNTFAVNYANGSPVVISGGGGNTGNVTFDNNIVIGTGDEFGGDGLFLAPGNGSIANSAVQYLRVRGGDYPTHIHLDTGNNQYYDQYFGADGRYVKLEANGNVVINADDYLGNSATWTLTTDGNLILAGGNSVIQSIANSSLDPLSPNASTMVLTPDQSYSSQALVLDPTSPGHIHLRAPSANIDEPSANIFLGGETSSFEVGYHNGAAPNLFIHSGNNTWTFDNAGNLTFPRDAAGNIDPILSIVSGATPTIVSTDASLTGPANLAIQSDYLNLSGSTGNRIILQADAGAIATDAAMVLSTNLADPGNIVSWTLDTTGNLYLPDTTSVIANVSITLEANDSGNITGLSVIGDANANLYAHGNVTIVSDSSNTNATWAFGTNGNLTLPGNLVITGNTSVFGTDSALIQTTDDLPLISISSGANGAIATTWIEDAGNIGTSNIAAVYANPIPGSKIVRIAVGQNGGPGPNLWDFNANGTTIFPGDLIGNGASPAPSISGFYNANFVGNVTADYFLGNGSQLTNLPAPSVAQDITSIGAMSIMTYDGNLKYVSYATVEPSSGNIAGGNISATGNISGANFIGTLANGNSNVRIATAAGNVVTNINGSAILTTYSGGIKVGGSGIIQSPGGAGAITLNNNGANIPTANITTFLNVTGASGANILGSANTGIGALNVGVSTTPLANTIASFNSNVNYYTQITLQNKSTGADATTDYVLTADNGSDTVNYGDFGIINSGYDNGTPTNSLGNIVFAADTYMYAQGNTGNASQSGGNLAIGTTVPGKNVKIFAGGVNSDSIIANIANTGVTVTGNLSVSGNITGNTNGFTIGYLNIPQVSASNTTIGLTDAGKHYYSTTAGNFTLTVPNNSTTSFATGTAISIVVQAAGNILVNAASGVTLYMAGNSTAANRVVGGYGMATLMKVGTDTWFINGTGVS